MSPDQSRQAILPFLLVCMFAMCSLGQSAEYAHVTPRPQDYRLLDFSATWCGPCKSMVPTIDRLEQLGYKVERIDIDNAPETAKRWGVSAVPTFVMTRDGCETQRIEGYTSLESLVAMYQPRTYEAAHRATGPPDLLDAVCRITSRIDDNSTALGSGCVYKIDSRSIYVMTNAHVVQNNKVVQVEFFHQGLLSPKMKARVILRDMHQYDGPNGVKYCNRDLAVVVVSVKEIDPLPSVIPISKTEPKVGDVIVSAGCPKGGWPAMYRGIVRKKFASIMYLTGGGEQGRSGSPICNAAGTEIVGLLAWSSDNDTPENMRDDWPIAMTLSEVRDALQKKPANGDDGSVRMKPTAEQAPLCDIPRIFNRPPRYAPPPAPQPDNVSPPPFDNPTPDVPQVDPVDPAPPGNTSPADPDCCLKLELRIALLERKLEELAAERCNTQKAGPRGPTGPAGIAGPQGPAGPSPDINAIVKQVEAEIGPLIGSYDILPRRSR